MTVPKVSVIVPIRNAPETASRTLDQLARQCRDVSAEVIAAISAADGTAVNVPDGMRLLTVSAPAGVPQLRRDAVLASRGEWIVITEDHCLFPKGWLAMLVRHCESRQGTVSGGPVQNARHSVAGWAQYFTRYSAFLPTRAGGSVAGLPGNNACYPRRLIFDRLDLLRDGFWEAEFNDALRGSGVPFELLSAAAVAQDQRRGAWEYVPLRFRHGRCYGARRSGGAKLLLFAPVLPALLFSRIARAVFGLRFERTRFLAAAPLILLYVLAWSAGEITGYLAGPGESCTGTD